jgi:hypothetical protein
MERSSRIAISVAALAALSLSARAQVQQVWERHYPAPPGASSYGMDVAVDAADEVLVVGSCNQLVDVLAVKYASDGTELWVRTWSGPGSAPDAAVAVAVDAGGNVFVAGWSEGTLTGKDVLTLAYDPAGNLLWSQRYDGPTSGEDLAADVAVDAAGQVYVTGTSAGAGTGEDVVTLSYDTAGNLLWVRRFDGFASGQDQGQVAEASLGGGVLVGGSSTVTGTDTDFATLSYDPAGNLVWSRTWDGPDGLVDRVTDLAVDGAGNSLVTGFSEQLAPAGTTHATATLKYDALGNRLWIHRFGAAGGTSNPCRVAVDAAGNAWVTGDAVPLPAWDNSTTLVKLDPAGTALWQRDTAPAVAYALEVDASGHAFVAGYVDGDQYPGGEQYDWQTWAYDAEGNQVWMALYDAPPTGTWDFAMALALDSAGRVLVTGSAEQVFPVATCTTIQYEVTCACAIDVYCAGKVNSLGCVPSISLASSPSASKGWGSTLRVVNLVPKQAGIFFHGTTGPAAKPFHGGFLCIAGAVRRHAVQPTLGASGSCSGQLSEDLNEYVATGKDPLLVPGATVYVQAWSRDPGDPFKDSLSDAVSALVCP